MPAVLNRVKGALAMAMVVLGLMGGCCFVPGLRSLDSMEGTSTMPSTNAALRGTGRSYHGVSASGSSSCSSAWAALVGSSVVAVAVGWKLASRHASPPCRGRAALVVVRAEGDDVEQATTEAPQAAGPSIEEAAAELSKAAYPFMKQVDWNSDLYWMVPGSDPISWAKAMGTIIDHGASMDADLVKTGCEAHHAAIKGLPSNGVCSEAELTAINAAIGRMIASVPESKTMDVYNAVKALVDPKVPEYLMSKVNEADAKAAYEALIKFTEAVKANPISPASSASKVSSSADSAISAAASELATAAYPFMQDIDWTDELYGKTIPGKSAQETLKAVDKMIVMGSQMDGAALKEAAMAHVKAIEQMDGKGVLTQEDFKAVLVGLGKSISSVPASSVMDVYDEMSKVAGLSSGIPAYVYAKQNPATAMSAYSALMQFKDTVRAYQPDPIGVAAAKLSKAAYPFMKQVDWNSDLYWMVPGADPARWTKAISKIISHGASMDGELVKAGCSAHHAAIANLPSDGVCSEAELTEINAAIGRMIASTPRSKTMDVYNAVKALVDQKVPEYLMSKVNEADAEAAYEALIEFTQVVAANPITPSSSASKVSGSADGAISAAASKLATAAYPFMQGVDWMDELYGKTIPGKSAQETVKAVDKMIVMGSQMDWPVLQEAALAHVGAIERMDKKGVLTQGDFKAVLAGLGKAISSVPASSVMDVYDEVGKLAGEGSGIPAYVYAKQNPANAMSAYGALMQFKDTVRAYQPDAIGAAAAELSKAAYPFMKQVDWNSNLYWVVPGSDPISWAKAIGTIIDHGASMDVELVKAGCQAHHAAIKGLSSNGVCSEAELTEINAAIGRMIASVPESKTMDVYNAVKELVDPKVPAYLMSKVNEADAKAAYAALIKFTEVVKANPITPFTPVSTVSDSSASAIDTAASELAKSAYPFMQGVEWTDELYGKTIPGQSAQETLQAVDKMIVMGTQMDGAALKEAAMAHVKAIENMDKNGVLTQADFEATLAGLGKAISSVPASSVMDVYRDMANLAGFSSGIPKYVYSKQKPENAMAAYSAFMKFKDVVGAAQPAPATSATPDATTVLFGSSALVAALVTLLHQ